MADERGGCILNVRGCSAHKGGPAHGPGCQLTGLRPCTCLAAHCNVGWLASVNCWSQPSGRVLRVRSLPRGHTSHCAYASRALGSIPAEVLLAVPAALRPVLLHTGQEGMAIARTFAELDLRALGAGTDSRNALVTGQPPYAWQLLGLGSLGSPGLASCRAFAQSYAAS